MKIFAFADLHLDSAFSLYPENERAERKEMLLHIFDKICKKCRDEKADLLLIAGDLFDVPSPSRACSDFVASSLASLGIPVVISPGNHDYYIPGEAYDKMPENVHVFKSEDISTHRIDELGISIDGFAFTSDSHAEITDSNGALRDLDFIRLLLAHTDVHSRSTPYAHISPRFIESEGYKFAFLGHVHTDNEVYENNGFPYAYSGIPQGRSIDEQINGGLRKIEIENGDLISNELIPLAEWSNMIYEIAIDDVTTDAESLRNIFNVTDAAKLKESDVLRIILVGEHGFYYTPNESFILKQLKKSLKGITLSLKNESIPRIDRDELLSDPSVIGVLYKTLFEDESYTEKYSFDQRSRAFRLALSAMRGDQLNYENI